MVLNIITIIALVIIIGLVHRIDPSIAGLMMTFPVITVLSIIITDPSETEKFIWGALSGIIPLTLMLLIYLNIYSRCSKFTALSVSFLLWCITATIQVIILGKFFK